MDFTLSSADLDKFLYSDILLYHNTGGVFSIDNLPRKKISKKCFIINTDPSFLPGKHWVAVFLPSVGFPEFFDSLGKNPSHYSEFLLDFLLEQNSNGFVYNCNRLQSFKSSTCGLFCLYYLYFRIRGFNFVDLVKRFGKNLKHNDLIVTDFYSHKN